MYPEFQCQTNRIQLSAADLNDSDLQFRQMTRGSLKGSMHLYNMRAVERLAWRKYGSPEGFDTVYAAFLPLCIHSLIFFFPVLRMPKPFGSAKEMILAYSLESLVHIDPTRKANASNATNFSQCLPMSSLTSVHDAEASFLGPH